MWILTGGNHQVHPWWQVLEQKGEGIVNRSGINNVVVIEDENEIVRDGSISLSKAVRIDSLGGG